MLTIKKVTEEKAMMDPAIYSQMPNYSSTSGLISQMTFGDYRMYNIIDVVSRKVGLERINMVFKELETKRPNTAVNVRKIIDEWISTESREDLKYHIYYPAQAVRGWFQNKIEAIAANYVETVIVKKSQGAPPTSTTGKIVRIVEYVPLPARLLQPLKALLIRFMKIYLEALGTGTPLAFEFEIKDKVAGVYIHVPRPTIVISLMPFYAYQEEIDQLLKGSHDITTLRQNQFYMKYMDHSIITSSIIPHELEHARQGSTHEGTQSHQHISNLYPDIPELSSFPTLNYDQACYGTFRRVLMKVPDFLKRVFTPD